MTSFFKKLLHVSLLILIGSGLGLSLRAVAGSVSDDNQKTYQKLALFGDVLNMVQEGYVEEPDPEKMTTDALNGLLQALDPHSMYEPPASFKEMQKRASREYGGLGIEVTMGENGLVHIGYVNPEGPAFKAGLKAGDDISRVAGEDIKGKTLDDAVKNMRGLAGDPITVTVISPGQAPRDVKIIREVIHGRAVRQRMIDGVGYVYLETFTSDKGAGDLSEAIDILKKENGGSLRGLVLDLRGNGGGLLTQSVKVAGLFLDGGEVVSVRGRKKEEHDRYHAGHGQKYAGPLVVLTNSGTASASEIVSGALQDRGRALIMGTQTFGKGSVQSVIPLDGGRKGALRLTTARYFTPSGRSIQGLGVTPDIWVESHPDDGKSHIHIYESSLPHALNKIILKTEGQNEIRKKPKPQFPPKDWPEDKDFQVEQAVKLLKSGTYYTKLHKAFGE